MNNSIKDYYIDLNPIISPESSFKYLLTIYCYLDEEDKNPHYINKRESHFSSILDCIDKIMTYSNGEETLLNSVPDESIYMIFKEDNKFRASFFNSKITFDCYEKKFSAGKDEMFDTLEEAYKFLLSCKNGEKIIYEILKSKVYHFL